VKKVATFVNREFHTPRLASLLLFTSPKSGSRPFSYTELNAFSLAQEGKYRSLHMSRRVDMSCTFALGLLSFVLASVFYSFEDKVPEKRYFPLPAPYGEPPRQ
jgi:hypothetical protein